MSLYNLTSNQYYSGLNKRFDARVRRLHNMGFYYDGAKQTYYRRTRWATQPKYGMPLTKIMQCDRRSWQEQLASLMK